MTLAGARRAYLVYVGQEAAGSFWFMMVITASGLFMIQDAHFDAHIGAARLLLVLHAVLIGMVQAFGFAASFEMAALSYVVTRIVRRVAMPIASAWINLGLTSDVRATVHSMNSQADALGQIAGGPLLGWLAVAAGGTRPAMLAAALILVPSLYLYLRTIRLHGRDMVIDEVVA